MMFQIIHFTVGVTVVLFFVLAMLASIRSAKHPWQHKRYQIYKELHNLSTGALAAAAGVYLLLGMGYQAAAWVFGFAS